MLKFILPLFLVLNVAMATNHKQDAIKQKLISITDQVGSLADARQWNHLEKLFDTKVLLDYSSMTKQPAEPLRSNVIMKRWEGFLPGFDWTLHKSTDHKVMLKKKSAKVYAKVKAVHYIKDAIGGSFWVVNGSYDYTLIKKKKHWVIESMTLNFLNTEGNNQLPAIALEKIKNKKATSPLKQWISKDTINNQKLWVKPKNPVAKGSEANKNLQLVVAFFNAYGKGDYKAIRKIVHDDVEWHIPGTHKLAGTKKGVDELVAFFNQLGKAGFKAEPMIFAANDHYVIDAHRGWSTKGKNGENVDLNWILLYQIIDGKIKRVQNFSGNTYLSDTFFNTFFNQNKE